MEGLASLEKRAWIGALGRGALSLLGGAGKLGLGTVKAGWKAGGFAFKPASTIQKAFKKPAISSNMKFTTVKPTGMKPLAVNKLAPKANTFVDKTDAVGGGLMFGTGIHMATADSGKYARQIQQGLSGATH